MTEMDPLTKWVQRVGLVIICSFFSYFVIGTFAAIFIPAPWWVLGLIFTLYPIKVCPVAHMVATIPKIEHAPSVVIANPLLLYGIGWLIYILIPIIIYKVLRRSGF